jgi:hypothetical protein
MDHGTCDNYKIFWYFNQADSECVRFYYGGCDGNQNRFENRESCQMTCKMSKEERQAFSKLPKQCLASMEYGSNCDEVTSKWYFDIQTKTCYPFEYSGCGPKNSNRFETFEECNQVCTTNLKLSADSSSSDKQEALTSKQPNDDEQSADDRDICDLPMAEGNCTQKATKWFYDKKAKYCRQFEFSGCNGNENRFETRQQCTEICETTKRRGCCLVFFNDWCDKECFILFDFYRLKKFATRTKYKARALITSRDGFMIRRQDHVKSSNMVVKTA